VGRALVPEEEEPLALYREIGERYFETMRIPLLRGRGFTTGDRSEAPWAAVVNETFARRAFGDEDPIGRLIQVRVNPRPLFLGPVPRLPNEDRPREILGVVGDTRDDLHRGPEPAIYVPFRQAPGHYVVYNGTFNFTLRKHFVVRASTEVSALIPAIKQVLSEIDAEQTLYGPVMLTSKIAESLESDRLWSQLLGVFAVLAIVLTGVGLYGVVSWTIEQRTRELGLRMALGARAKDVRRMIVRHGLALGLAGIVVGAFAAAGLTRFLESRLYGIEPDDPATFLAASLTVAFVSFLASYLPARRATRIDPLTALRNE
jgi:putative ABC transport system permease protein